MKNSRAILLLVGFLTSSSLNAYGLFDLPGTFSNNPFVPPCNADSDTLFIDNISEALDMNFNKVESSLRLDLKPIKDKKLTVKAVIKNTDNKKNMNRTSDYLIVSTALTDTIRIGGFLDKVIYNDLAPSIKVSTANPVMGIFIGFNHDNERLGGKIAYSYLKNSMLYKRHSDLVEIFTPLKATGIIGEVHYGKALNRKTMISPYLALNNINLSRDGYTENSTTLVTEALTYNTVNATRTGMTLGARLEREISPYISIIGHLGLDKQLSIESSDLIVSGISCNNLITKLPINKKNRFLTGLSLNARRGPGLASINYSYSTNIISDNSSSISFSYKIDL